MKILKWEEEDAIAIERLEKLIFHQPWSYQSILDAIRCPAFCGYKLCDKEKIIGYYGYYSIPPEAHVANVAIAKEYRGRGYSKLLMDDLLVRAAKEGITDLTLEVRVSNKIAINLYGKYGFKQEGLRKGYYGDGEDAAILWLRNNL